MASLKDIKNHIGSVRSTLKITSAMKMVASAKLRKAQLSVEGMRPYEAALHRISVQLAGGVSAEGSLPAYPPRTLSSDGGGERISPAVALVVLSSNSSLCGGFNANVIRAARAAVAEIKKDPLGAEHRFRFFDTLHVFLLTASAVEDIGEVEIGIDHVEVDIGGIKIFQNGFLDIGFGDAFLFQDYFDGVFPLL